MMPFDRTDPADLQALQTEVLTDPIGMGYNPDSTQNGVLKPINTPEDNVGGETAGEDLTPKLVLDAVEPSEYGNQQTEAGAPNYVHTLIEAGNQEIPLEPYRAKLVSMFAANSATVANLNSQNRLISRGEVLFGLDTIISRDDWIAARDYTA